MNRGLFPWQSLKTRITLFTLAIFVLSIWSLAFYVARMLREDMERLVGEQQSSTAFFIATEVEQELNDRLKALATVSSEMTPGEMADPAALQRHLDQRPLLRRLFNGGVNVVNPDGTVIADVPLTSGRMGKNYRSDKWISAALESGRSMIGRPVMGRALKSPVFVITVPVLDPQGSPIGALSGVVNLGKPNFLDKITNARYGRTGGYILADPRRRLIITATDKSRIMESLPAPGTVRALDRFIQGHNGSAVWVDHQGVEQLVSAETIPISHWMLLVLLPADEAFAPIRDAQDRVVFATVLLTLLAAALTWWMMRRQLMPMLAAARTLVSLKNSDGTPHSLPIAKADEIGDLIGSFNALLETLAKRELLLRESEATLAKAQQVAHLGSWKWHIQEDRYEWSDPMRQILGVSTERAPEDLKAVIARAIHPDDRIAIARARDAVLRDKAPVSIEFRASRPDGTVRELYAETGELTLDKAGRPLILTGIVQDITERKRAEAARRASDDQLRAFYELDLVGLAITSPEKGWVRVNHCLCQMLEYSESELRAMTWAQITHPDDLPADVEQFEKLVAGEIDTYSMEKRFITRSGRAIPTQLVVRCVRTPDGETKYVTTMVEDLTERVRMEEALRLHDLRYRTVVETSSDGFWVVDTDGRLLDVNEAYARRSGFTREELLRMHVYDLNVNETKTEAEAHIRAIIGRGGDVFDAMHRTKDGEVWPVEVSVHYRANQSEPLMCFLRDVTSRKEAEDALARESRRNEVFLRNASDGVYILDADGRLLEASDSFGRMLGFTRQELIGAHVSLWNVEESAQSLEQDIRSLLATDARKVFETRHRCKDGRLLDVEITAQRLELDGKLAVFNSSRDITERNRVESELRTLSRAIEQSPVSIVITDIAGNIQYVNPRFEHVTGYTRAEAIGRNPRILKSGTAPPEVYERLWATITKGGEWRGELCNRRKNGELYWEAASISSVINDKGVIEHYIAVKEDITEHKRATEALLESESRLSAIFHSSPIAISVARISDGMILDANEAALRIYGYERGRLIGRTVAELDLYADPSQRDALMSRLREQGQLERAEVDLRDSGGSIRKVEVTGRTVELRGEAHLVAMMVDVTERKHIEQMHLRAQKLESLGTLTAGIAHDFNNILAAIQGNASLAAQDVRPDHDAAESLAEIVKASTRASELVRRIMAFGQASEPRQELVDLGESVEEVLKLLRATLPAEIALLKKFSKGTPRVKADSGQVHEVVVNLTTNAGYAIGRHAGSIEYRLEPIQLDAKRAKAIPGLSPGLYSCLTVTDTGCGMDAATMERIFDAFFTTKPVGKGTGLGLSMVHGTMKSHGGAVTVTSAPGEGTSFSLYFPAVQEDPAKKERNKVKQVLPAAARRVLYVDDEEALTSLAYRALSRLGHKVSVFTDPNEALQVFRDRPQDFDVVVTDLSMPRMSGFELAREVLRMRSDMPVLMTTGYIRAEDEVIAQASGIRKLILKPTTIDELAQHIDRLLGGEEGSGKRATGIESQEKRSRRNLS